MFVSGGSTAGGVGMRFPDLINKTVDLALCWVVLGNAWFKYECLNVEQFQYIQHFVNLMR